MAAQRSLIFEPVKPPRRRRSFHAQALNISPERYAAESAAAATQEQKVLAVFGGRPDEWLTPFDVEKALGICLNSARRAISDLADAGLLQKSADTVTAGQWGKRSHRWKLKEGA